MTSKEQAGKQKLKRAIDETEALCKVAGPFEANVCLMPRPTPRREATVYRHFRDLIVKAHCADHRDSHRCTGTVTIDRNSITFQCPRCGDAKKIIVEGKDDGDVSQAEDRSTEASEMDTHATVSSDVLDCGG